MILFLLIMVDTALKGSNAYSIIEVPKDTTPSFQVYWNVPTENCNSYGVYFPDLYDKFGIIQNKNEFYGDKIVYLKEPGLFPGYAWNWRTKVMGYKNGRVPQEGSLIRHIDAFKHDVVRDIPDKLFNGIAVIDMQNFKPIFRQNFEKLKQLNNISLELAGYDSEMAVLRYQKAAREFLETTLITAKELRPYAKWGYFGYPYCYNMQGNKEEQCDLETRQENEYLTSWLWAESDALFPSLYLHLAMTPSELASLIRGRITEAARLVDSSTPILPYFSYLYRSSSAFFTPDDLDIAIRTIYKSEATGFVIWGDNNEVDTLKKCSELLTYVNELLGPVIAKYTKKEKKEIDFPTFKSTALDPTILEPITEPDDYETLVPIHPSERQGTTVAQYKQPEIFKSGNKNNKITETSVPVNEIEIPNLIYAVNTTNVKQANSNDTNNMRYVKEDITAIVLHRTYYLSDGKLPPYPSIYMGKDGINFGNVNSKKISSINMNAGLQEKPIVSMKKSTTEEVKTNNNNTEGKSIITSSDGGGYLTMSEPKTISLDTEGDYRASSLNLESISTTATSDTESSSTPNSVDINGNSTISSRDIKGDSTTIIPDTESNAITSSLNIEGNFTTFTLDTEGTHPTNFLDINNNLTTIIPNTENRSTISSLDIKGDSTTILQDIEGNSTTSFLNLGSVSTTAIPDTKSNSTINTLNIGGDWTTIIPDTKVNSTTNLLDTESNFVTSSLNIEGSLTTSTPDTESNSTTIIPDTEGTTTNFLDMESNSTTSVLNIDGDSTTITPDTESNSTKITPDTESNSATIIPDTEGTTTNFLDTESNSTTSVWNIDGDSTTITPDTERNSTTSALNIKGGSTTTILNTEGNPIINPVGGW